MKITKYLSAILVLILTLPVAAEELVAPLRIGDADGVLRIEAVTGEPTHIIAELPAPAITSGVWAIKGMVRYEAVEGVAHLQLDNDFGDLGTYFTKSLAPDGPLATISGTTDWRSFTLPFNANTGDQAGASVPTPEALTLSLILPQSGTVFLRDVALYQYADSEDPMASGTQWFGTRTATLVGAIGGSLVGIWGGLIGFLASRGKARGFAIGSANVLIAFGLLSFIGGIVAFATGQPYAAWYPLVLFGVILMFVVGWIRKILPQRYEAHELKKMQSMDA